MENIFFKILLILFIGVIIYTIYNIYTSNYVLEHTKCNLEKFDIDDMVIIKRTPEYSKLINNLIDKKKFIFTDEQLKILKNPQQIYNVNDEQQNIKNISDIVYTNCKNELNSNNDIDNNNLIDVSSNEYDNITKMLKYDIKQTIKPNCCNTGVLKNDMPLIDNYLKNYYQDLYGNKVDANLSDYFSAYYTFINNDDNVGLPVNTLVGHSDFVIPDQYNYDSRFTNAYNIDWDRIINPIGYSM